MKPMKACNWDPSKVKFPAIVQPKIDGVRMLTTEHIGVTGRSLKPFANYHINQVYGRSEYAYMDGELIVNFDATAKALCRNTTSAVTTEDSRPKTSWWVFDILDKEYRNEPYQARLEGLKEVMQSSHSNGACELAFLIPYHVVINLDQIYALHEAHIKLGYEGTIGRWANGLHKEGRATTRESGFWRIKDFVEEEAIVLELVEGETNLNEQQTNELGNSFRTSHQANKVPNGMVGMLICRDLKTQVEIKVSAGVMNHTERKYYLENPNKIVGHMIKYQHFPHGAKDKPRFPTFQGFRAKEDM